MQHHSLKTWPEYFQAVIEGRKNFEVRENDRNFRPGDQVTLQEWSPMTHAYTGRTCGFVIGYVTDFGQRPGFVVFSLKVGGEVAS